ncbi:MAG: hypothetical protein AAF828_03050 [Bacteroidota bacterium]
MIISALQDHFLSLSPQFTPADWERIRAAYTHKSRHYHNLNHLTQMFAALEEYPTAITDHQSLAIAIYYHDFVYNALRKDNELQSAEVMQGLLLSKGFASTQVQKIYTYILATKTHELPDPMDTDLAVLLDLDLGILGTNKVAYHEYTQQIRKEYRWVPKPLYRAGRRKVLAHFLAKPFLYQTTYFRVKWESQARENLQRELETLQ